MNLEQAKALGKKEFHSSAAKLNFETRNLKSVWIHLR